MQTELLQFPTKVVVEIHLILKAHSSKMCKWILISAKWHYVPTGKTPLNSVFHQDCRLNRFSHRARLDPTRWKIVTQKPHPRAAAKPLCPACSVNTVRSFRSINQTLSATLACSSSYLPYSKDGTFASCTFSGSPRYTNQPTNQRISHTA